MNKSVKQLLTPDELGFFQRIGNAWKSLTSARFSGGSNVQVVRTYSTWAEFDRAYFGDSATLNYAKEVGDPLCSSLVMAAVRWVGNNLPEADLKVMEGTDEKGDSKVVDNHPMVSLFRHPNPFYSGATLWKGFAQSWVPSGNAYFWKVRNASKKVVELWYIPHWMIRPRWPESGRPFIEDYGYSLDSKEYPIPREDIIHFRDGFDPANLRLGLSPLMALWRELYGDAMALTYAAKVSRNFGVPPFVLSPKPDQSGVDVSVEKIKASLMRAITGDNTGKPLVLDAAFDVKTLGGSVKDMDMRTQHRLPEERVAAVMGIPAIVLGYGAGLDRSTYSNMEQAEEHAYESYLLPLHKYIEEELDVQLLPDLDDKQDRYVVHDLSKVRALQEDEDGKFKRIESVWNSGIIDLAEARSALGYTAMPEQEGMFKTAAPVEPVLPEPEPEEELFKAYKALKSKPSKEEIAEAVEWWEKYAPDGAKDLINAKKANGDSEVLSG